MPKEPPEAILTDLDGTLYRALPVKLAMAAELVCLGLPHLGTLRRFRQQHERIRAEQSLGETNAYELQLQWTASELGRSAEWVGRVVQHWMEVRPVKWIRCFARRPLLAELRAFQDGGGKVAVVSDYPANNKLRAFESWLRFDAVVASGEAGGPRRLKPDPEGYLAAAAKLGVLPAKCLVLGDRADADGVAADRAGMAFRLIR